jgi:hypothetical protein
VKYTIPPQNGAVVVAQSGEERETSKPQLNGQRGFTRGLLLLLLTRPLSREAECTAKKQAESVRGRQRLALDAGNRLIEPDRFSRASALFN